MLQLFDCGINNLAGVQNFMPSVGILQVFFIDQIDLAAKQGFYFRLHFQMGIPGQAVLGGKGEEHINVAIRAKVVAQDRAEEGKFDDVPALAKVSNLDRGCLDSVGDWIL